MYECGVNVKGELINNKQHERTNYLLIFNELTCRFSKFCFVLTISN
jgi:hypothetical protein